MLRVYLDDFEPVFNSTPPSLKLIGLRSKDIFDGAVCPGSLEEVFVEDTAWTPRNFCRSLPAQSYRAIQMIDGAWNKDLFFDQFATERVMLSQWAQYEGLVQTVDEADVVVIPSLVLQQMAIGGCYGLTSPMTKSRRVSCRPGETRVVLATDPKKALRP